jgi:hypothetical protein
MPTRKISPRRKLSGGKKKPSYKIMIKAAILALKDHPGSSLPSIKRFLNFSEDKSRYINAALRNGVANGYFIKNKGKYKLGPQSKEEDRKRRFRRRCLLHSEDRIQPRLGKRDPPMSRCRPGPNTPCNIDKYLRKRRLGSRRTKKGGKIYECVRRKRSAKK